MDSSRGFFILLLVACCLLDLAFCLGDEATPMASPPAPPAASPPAASDETPPPSPPGVPRAPSGYETDNPVPPAPPPPPIPVPPPPHTMPVSSPLPSPSPVLPLEPPPTPPPPGNTWNASEKAGVVIASIAALLQVAVVAFLLIKRHQMLTTVDYDDIDDLESDHIRHNANYRQAGSA